jgi:hypothetical protein
MPELTRDLFIELWQMTKAQREATDADLARMQKFMAMHEDMHPHFELFEANPQMPLEVEGENLGLHIAMDAATEKALETDEPAGVRALMQALLDTQMDPGQAFHVISQAMQHAFLQCANAGREMDEMVFMAMARQYALQASGGQVQL